MTAYDRDLAYIHDTGFTGFARKAAPGLLRLLRQNRVAGGLVVDAGCGSGVWARELTECGEDRRHKILTRRIVSFRRLGKSYRRSEEMHRLYLYSGSELLTELSRAGFEARLLGGYGRFRFAPAHAGFVARKKT